MGSHTSSSLTLKTGAPQGCFLSPLLYSLYTHDCKAVHDSNIKFADDTAVDGLISKNNEQAYSNEVDRLSNWCQDNKLLLNVTKTKEMFIDFRRDQQKVKKPLQINDSQVERVESFKYLGVHMSEDLTWTKYVDSLVRKARQCLFHLRRLKYFRLPQQLLKNFYRATIEIIITGNITAWYGNRTLQDRKALKRVVRSAERTTRNALPNLEEIYITRVKSRVKKITRDPSHPNSCLFFALRSGKCHRCLRANTERMRKRFYPQAIRILNEDSSRSTSMLETPHAL